MYLLDTDTMTHLQAGHPRVLAKLQSVDATTPVGTTVVTRIELLLGRFEFLLKADSSTELRRAQDLLARTDAFLSGTLIVPVDSGAANEFDRLKAMKKLRKIGRRDILISFIVLAHRATLVTRNLKHFRQVPNLTVENWVDT